MASTTTVVKFQLRRDTATNWNSASLYEGEPGFDTTNNILKIGPTGPPTPWTNIQPIGPNLNLVDPLALGYQSGYTGQNNGCVALGYQAGNNGQQQNAVAIGYQAGYTGQKSDAIAIGYQAGQTRQQSDAIAIGSQAGQTRQQSDAIAIGRSAGYTGQNDSAIAIGFACGTTNQGTYAVGLGVGAGSGNQGKNAVAIGLNSGCISQNPGAVAIGNFAGNDTQGPSGVAIGDNAGANTQGTGSIAIGYQSGNFNQGEYAIAIGANAGYTGQGPNSIIINATGVDIGATGASGCYIAPIRNETAPAGLNSLYYNTTTNEIVNSSSVLATLYSPTRYLLNSWNDIIPISQPQGTYNVILKSFTIPTGGSGIWHFGLNFRIEVTSGNPYMFLSFRWFQTANGSTPDPDIDYYSDYTTIYSSDLQASNTMTYTPEITASGLSAGDQFSIGYFLGGFTAVDLQYTVKYAECWQMYATPIDVTA